MVSSYYFDSSTIVKRYAPEEGSEWVKSVLAPEGENTVYLAQIGVVEIAAALARKVRTEELSREESEGALDLFLADVARGEYLIAPLNDVVVGQAVELTKRHPLRGYDAVHLATALSLNLGLVTSELPPLTFVAADEVLCEAAQDEELKVINPNRLLA